jgi:hypothetical protein
MTRICLPGLTALLLASCSSVDSRLYEPGDPPRLKDGTITMKTSWAPANDKAVDIRRIKARGGAVTCELISPERGHLTGNVPEGRWVEVWNKLFEWDPFGPKRLSVDPDDPKGGPYHHIRLELGSQASEFSSQLRQNILVFSTRDITDRLELSGAITDVVTEYARESLAPPENR